MFGKARPSPSVRGPPGNLQGEKIGQGEGNLGQLGSTAEKGIDLRSRLVEDVPPTLCTPEEHPTARGIGRSEVKGG